MKKLISTLLFAGSLSWLALPAAADVQVQDMNVVQADHTAKVHFALVNPDSYITQEAG